MDRACSYITARCVINTKSCIAAHTVCCCCSIHDGLSNDPDDFLMPQMRENTENCIGSWCVFLCYCCDERTIGSIKKENERKEEMESKERIERTKAEASIKIARIAAEAKTPQN